MNALQSLTERFSRQLHKAPGKTGALLLPQERPPFTTEAALIVSQLSDEQLAQLIAALKTVRALYPTDEYWKRELQRRLTLCEKETVRRREENGAR